MWQIARHSDRFLGLRHRDGERVKISLAFGFAFAIRVEHFAAWLAEPPAGER
jgi:hypothetical protein